MSFKVTKGHFYILWLQAQQKLLETEKENSGPQQSPKLKQKTISQESKDSKVIVINENNVSVIHNSENLSYQNNKNIADFPPKQTNIHPVTSSNYTTSIPQNQLQISSTSTEQNSGINTRKNYINQAAFSTKENSLSLAKG